MKHHYVSPILSSIFRGIGVLGILVSLALLAFLVLASMSLKRDGAEAYDTIFGIAIVQAVFALVASIIFAVINFGIAQVIEYMAKTAYFTEFNNVMLQKIYSQSQAPNPPQTPGQWPAS